MTYTVLGGQFVIRYADLPRQGPEPDGDTVKFQPDHPALVDTLPRPSGGSADLGPRGISVRLEAIDALETHFGDTHQELLGADQARDALLAQLGFTGVTFFADAPNRIEHADADTIRGHVLSNGIDANGRMIGFVYPGEPAAPDGSRVFLDDDGVDASVNASLLAAGLAYPAFYGTLPASLRAHLSVASRAARAAGTGIWPRSTADPNGAATVVDLAALEQLVTWPKLFRRLVSYLASGATDFDGFDSWLRADPVDRDDALLLLGGLERANLHDVVRANGHRVQLTAWPEDFVIEPDPAPAGASTGATALRAGSVVLVAARPDPVGRDRGQETVTLINTTAAEVSLAGWRLSNGTGGRHPLDGALPAGAVLQVPLSAGMSLGNAGDTVLLVDGTEALVDQVSYASSGVHPGRTICFGR